MASKPPFLPRLSISRNEKSSTLPAHDSGRYASLRSEPSAYDLDELSPRADDGLLPLSFHDPTSSPTTATRHTSKPSNRKPTGAPNRRPSNSSSSAGSASKSRPTNERVLFTGPPPPIAVSRVFFRDEEQQRGYNNYEDEETHSGGIGASWLPGTARRAISSVIWDRDDSHSAQDRGDRPVSYDRNSVWRALARRERAIVVDVQQFLQVQEDSLAGGDQGHSGMSAGSSENASDAGSVTPTGTRTPSVASSRHPGRSVSFLEPVTRSGPGGEVIPVRQPRKKRIGINSARKGIARSMAELADLKAEEDASLLSALSMRKQALAKLRKLSTRHDGIVEELHALEADEEEPLAKELEDLDSEHRGVCAEILELEERLAGLKTRRRYLEGTMDDVRNRREAGLSGYKNALKEVEDSVKGFLTRPPIKPLDVAALAENTKSEDQLPSPGGVEFMHLRPERRTIAMAREWWESEVKILEKRKAEVDTERAALEEGGEVWEEVVTLVLGFEADLRQLMQGTGTPSGEGKGKEREHSPEEALKLQYEKINTVIVGLGQRLTVAEEKGWNLLIAAIGAELEAFREAARVNRQMLQAAGISLDEQLLATNRALDVAREDSGTTESHNSFHTVTGGSLNADQLLDLPNRHEDEAAESDNEVPHDLLATHDEVVHSHDLVHGDGTTLVAGEESAMSAAESHSLDREDSENEVPPEFLVEHHDVGT